MCSERDSPLKRLYRRTHAKLIRLAGFGQLVWAAGCELSLTLVHARRPAWPGETSETMLRVAPPHKTRLPDNTRVNWPVDASASGSAQVGSGGHHRWAARVQVGREPARQKAREGYPSWSTHSHFQSFAMPPPRVAVRWREVIRHADGRNWEKRENVEFRNFVSITSRKSYVISKIIIFEPVTRKLTCDYSCRINTKSHLLPAVIWWPSSRCICRCLLIGGKLNSIKFQWRYLMS